MWAPLVAILFLKTDIFVLGLSAATTSSANKNQQRSTTTAVGAFTTWPSHSGYHGGILDDNKGKQTFFEGWYLRIVTRNQGSLALIFHIFDPHDDASERKGVGCQVVTPQGTFSKISRDTSRFQAESHRLNICNEFPATRRSGELLQSYPDFFRLTTDIASGKITSRDEADNEIVVDFDFGINPQVGWGTAERQYSVAGFLAAFPVFEPHYQVLLSRGDVPRGFLKLSATATTKTTVYDLADATIYLEKNWGGSFPSRWFWIQANTFVDASASSSNSHVLDLCLTSTGGLRRLPFSLQHSKQEEQVALIALHWNGKFLPFPQVEWTIEWGKWIVRGAYEAYIVEVQGTCQDKVGFPVNCPTERGMEEIAMETFEGELRIKLFEKGSRNGVGGRIVLEAIDTQACLEIGGLPWNDLVWVGESAMEEPIKSIAMNVDLENKASDFLRMAANFVEIPGF
jgi:tocopherol cyclase